MRKVFWEGNEAVAWGALHAGCRFFAGYPITPATTILHTMLRILPPNGGIVMQGEDEIASIGFCIGASMAGYKAMTATSGPGISLYSENISFAIACEIPLVIVDVQRLGPSTGSATRGADGDVQFIRWSNTGGFPTIVLCPTTVSDCYSLTIHAFNLAERFRCPVFIASNKEIGMTREVIDLDELEKPPLLDRMEAPKEEVYLPYRVSSDGRVPYFLPIGARGRLSRFTSSTHGEDGYITTNPEHIERQNRRLEEKLISSVDEFTFYDYFHKDNADTLVISYGITARSALEAARTLESKAQTVSLLVLKTLWPVPEKLIREKAKDYERIAVVEMNTGQYVREISRVLCRDDIISITKMNGTLITPEEIERSLSK
ncbi:transketolase C-terminal domain-containing protein [Thermodesulforhabdus norvegica]|uniref:2-oxoglutarate ferredoxin oxidoreductase subunit alpha n=1 Tax=Thermodesulforhabdus norvegica TaxID=39841 RepID=A0A1I4R2A2_9BACT|nr:transketolase C-terminal domain-containing protein [Thermodesulforhabdus norvegica]SFM46454.1 2-oxoglutarate ferredoxin oxidoreductase subunit alpha [Thermodesulforhabdus norvegica]